MVRSIRQSERFPIYRAAIDRLAADGRVYPCFCTRRQIRAEIDAAAQAPHAHLPDGAYPGTCRDLTQDQRRQRLDSGRSPALRLRTDGEVVEFIDLVHGPTEGAVDDVVLARADGVPAYNLAVVVDDAAQGVTQVTRGDDLLTSTPRQILLQRLLGMPTPDYLHVPLVLGDDGQRLAKRHGAVTLADWRAQGKTVPDLISTLAVSLRLSEPGEAVTAAQLVERFDPSSLPRLPSRLADLSLP